MLSIKELIIESLEESIEQDIEYIARNSPVLPDSEVEQIKARFLAGWPKQWPPEKKSSLPESNLIEYIQEGITYTLKQIQELGQALNPPNFAYRSTKEEQARPTLKIDLERQFWVPVDWKVTTKFTYLKLKCCSETSYPISAPKIHIYHNGQPITEEPLMPMYKKGLLEVQIPQALPDNENTQVGLSHNNRDTTELFIDVVE